MIEIAIIENKQRPSERPLRPWLATVTQTTGQARRILQRAFATNPEAWQWADKITRIWKKETPT
jgi:hypothetical protein